jgi:hypothetical protein
MEYDGMGCAPVSLKFNIWLFGALSSGDTFEKPIRLLIRHFLFPNVDGVAGGLTPWSQQSISFRFIRVSLR